MFQSYDEDEDLNGDEIGSAGGALPPPPPRPPPSPSEIDGLEHPFFHGTGSHDQVESTNKNTKKYCSDPKS